MSKKNILITGCGGFIGSHLIEHLQEQKYNVVGVDVETYACNRNFVKELLVPYYRVDICNTEVIDFLCKKHKIEWIINCAAMSHVDNSIKDPMPFIHSNIKGVASLLEVCRRKQLKLLNYSTDETFGSYKTGQALETSMHNPQNPYSASKSAGDLLIQAYANTHGVKYVLVRPTNNFGPRQHKEKFLPTILNSIKENKKIPVYGKGEQKRDWLYVKDCVKYVENILMLSDKNKKYNEIYNLTCKKELANINFVKLLLKLTDKKENMISFVADRVGHDFRYAMDNSKVKKLLKKDIDYNDQEFEEKLKETIKYYHEF